MAKAGYSSFRWTYQRELGSTSLQTHSGYPHKSRDVVVRSLWKNMWRNTALLQFGEMRQLGFGGIFGLSYSPCGDMLVAACENKSLVVIDPLSEKVLKQKENAHDDCCNNISFLDDRLFASCSDDCTVALWDVRMLSNKVFSLTGHSSWVKNVELHKPSGKLVSSGFDSKILLWDLNNTGNNGKIKADVLLTVEGLLRIKLSPQGDSMYISSTVIPEVMGIHNLDIHTLERDVKFLQRIHGCRGVKTKQRNIRLHDLRQSFPVTTRNHIDFYWRDATVLDYVYGREVPCHSIDVHPRNSAILLHHMSANDKLTAVHNTRRQYSFTYDADEDAELALPLTRGVLTHHLSQPVFGSGEYIEEVSFSSCGRLIASPKGCGVCIVSFDEELNDYESHIAAKTYKHQIRERGQFVSGAGKRIKMERHQLTLTPCGLHPISLCLGHGSQVLSTCFSPTHLQLASGSEEGRVVFHNPVLGSSGPLHLANSR